jgi:predicted nucleic acid-binding protein
MKTRLVSMASKIFIDANVLLDFTLKRQGYLRTKQLMETIVHGQATGYVSTSVIHIVGYWMTKAYGSVKSKELLLSPLTSVKVIDINHEVALHTLHSKIDDIEDALQYFTAVHHKLDAFISEDKHFKKVATSVLPIYTTDEFLKLLSQA